MSEAEKEKVRQYAENHKHNANNLTDSGKFFLNKHK